MSACAQFPRGEVIQMALRCLTAMTDHQAEKKAKFIAQFVGRPCGFLWRRRIDESGAMRLLNANRWHPYHYQCAWYADRRAAVTRVLRLAEAAEVGAYITLDTKAYQLLNPSSEGIKQ